MRLAGIMLLILMVSWGHPIHVSVCNLDLEPSKGSIELSIKVFSDDFQDLILHRNGVQLQLMEQLDPGTDIVAVNNYIGEALQIRLNGGNPIELEYLRTEFNEEATWFYYRYDHAGQVRKIQFNNKLLLEKFDDQTNLMIVSWEKKQNGYRLDNKNTELSLSIK